MAKKRAMRSPRSEKAAGRPKSSRPLPVRRRQKTATAAVRKDTMLVQSTEDPRALACMEAEVQETVAPVSVRFRERPRALNCGSSSLKFQVFARDPGALPAGVRRLARVLSSASWTTTRGRDWKWGFSATWPASTSTRTWRF